MKIKNIIPESEFTDNSDDILETEIKNCTSNYKNANADTLLFLIPGVNFDTYEKIPDFPLSHLHEHPGIGSGKFKR